MFEIGSPRLRLISCDLEILDSVMKGNECLAGLLGIIVPDKWSEFGMDPIRFSYKKIESSPEQLHWFTYLPVYRADNLLIGTCGYKGKPDEEGMVEIGYEVIKSYRGQGLAKEIAGALIRHAFKCPGVTKVQAHTLAEENASVHVLKNCGMTRMQELIDPDDGRLWRWEILKHNYLTLPIDQK